MQFLKNILHLVFGINAKPAYDVRPFLKNPDPRKMTENAKNELEKIYYSHTGRQSFKWHHYLPIYDAHLSRFRNKKVSILEIGVQYGGSLQIWRKYFGNQATIFGVDINPNCSSFNDEDAQVRIGSQADPDFLKKVVSEMGGSIDIVIDDGSHIAEHQRISMLTLFPLLKDGGVYICEDVHTSYWKVFHNGGYKRKGTFIEFTKQIMDDLHSTYHEKPSTAIPEASTDINSISIYDSIIIFEKKKKDSPFFSGMPPI